MISDYIIQILHETHKCKWTFFVQIIFYKNCILAKKNFLLNHTSWVYFLDYMSLPYHFGKLWMSTFNCFQWFFTKAKRIHVIPTNTRELFFGPDLMSGRIYFNKEITTTILFNQPFEKNILSQSWYALLLHYLLEHQQLLLTIWWESHRNQ